ncbi:MAG: hypothetical protein KME25_22780 [Symplocastrum torsivum CPER-KK1]|jgi:hypothetical protein|uniref:KGK family protein n=1 Tax=Symplocastrum torsivum CPER-KK1 TaxID=450513 RepID=A0A951PP23_9CYAN|nr:hypothetical protein [Symplocastrum torsivum CPER-KK1]
MEEKFSLQNCDEDDVLLFGDDTFKVSKFRRAVNAAFGNNLGDQLNRQLSSYHGIKIDNAILAPKGVNEPYARWFTDGIDCEMLQLGSKSWQKGKVRIKVSVEFYVEEDSEQQLIESSEIELPESPLDDLRQMMNQENQQS